MIGSDDVSPFISTHSTGSGDRLAKYLRERKSRHIVKQNRIDSRAGLDLIDEI